MAVWILAFSGSGSAIAHTSGASSIHEISRATAPSAELVIMKDPTGGFNVQVLTSRFIWRPDMASLKYVEGEGHAHVFLDGEKIMRIYNNWFHLNTFQFATRAGEQLVSVELVGNDHAPYTLEGLAVGAEALVDVPADEIGPKNRNHWKPIAIGAITVAFFILSLQTLRTLRKKHSRG